MRCWMFMVVFLVSPVGFAQGFPTTRTLDDLLRLELHTIKAFAPGTYPRLLCEREGALYFTADDGEHGREPWRSDGTPAGTQLLKDIHPGPGASVIEVYSKSDLNKHFHQWNGKFYFLCDDGTDQVSLWVSDGTTSGTRLVAPVAPRAAVVGFLDGTNRFLFFRVEYLDQSGLWRTDGTAAGTVPLHTGFQLRIPNHPRLTEPCAVLGGNLLFFYLSGIEDQEGFWCSDGTDTGTERLQAGRIYRGEQEWIDTGIIAGDRTVLFVGNDGSLWSTDGNLAGTAPVAGFDNAGHIYHKEFPLRDKEGIPLTLAGKRFFIANHQLYATNGSPRDTVLVCGVPNRDAYLVLPDTFFQYYSWAQVNTFQGSLVYAFQNRERSKELRRTAFPAGDTSTLAEFAVEDLPGYGLCSLREIRTISGRLFFTDLNLMPPSSPDSWRYFATELWLSDGTPEGMASAGTYPQSQIDLDDFAGWCFFWVRDAEGRNWVNVSDGTVEGTQRLNDVASHLAALFPGEYSPAPWSVLLGNTLYFGGAGGLHALSTPVSGRAPAQGDIQ